MANHTIHDRRWILVHVWRGIPTGIEAYHDERAARRREQSLRESIEMEDELALFELDLAKGPAVVNQ